MGKGKTLDPQVAYDFAKRHEGNLKLENAMNFSDLQITPPAINVYQDGVQFFDPNRNEIHIGTTGIVNMFSVQDTEEMFNGLRYIQGHEEQHRRSTASEPYGRAIKRGIMKVIDYVALVEEGKPVRLRNERDYNDYVSFTLKDKGIVLNMEAVRGIIQHIANSIEDGRIERIRSARLPGFNNMRKYFRGKFWERDEPEYVPYAEMDAGDKLDVFMNQILYLATCQLYQRGFVKAYAGTDILKIVDSLMPFIARGIMSGSVRGIEPEVIGIADVLAPYIYEVVRLSEEDVEMMEKMNKMLAEMLKAMIDNLPENMPLDERDEDTDDGGTDSTFSHSDLVITLKDEDYDKLMEKMKDKKQGGKGGGITIRREHPKEEEEDNKEGNGEGGSGSKDEKGEDSKNSGSEGSSKDGSKENPEKEGEKSSGNQNADSDKKEDGSNSDSKDSGSSKDRKDADDKSQTGREGNKDGAEGSGEDKPQQDSSESADMTGKAINREWKSVKGKSARNGSSSSAEKDVLDEIKETGSLVREVAKSEMSHINEQSGHEKKNQKIVEDKAPALKNDDVKDVLEGTGFNFREVKRTYEVDTDLPPVVKARGKALHRKMEKYFRSMRTPNIRNLSSGAVDPSMIYSLAMNETDIFRRNGKDKLFDGCAYILIDNSGSMWGEKFDEACTAAAVIEEGFRGLFPIKIVSFNDSRRIVVHSVVKGWDESLAKNCSWNYCVHERPGDGNADGCSIRVATKELLKRPEKKKLLVVLSDGAPTEGGSDPVKLTKDAIAEARKKHIQVSGIYFELGQIGPYADVFKDCYKKDYVCCPLSELDKNLTRVFEKFSRS